MVFKTKQEKAQAILDLPSEPDGGVDDLDAWNAEHDAKVKEIEEALVEEDGDEPAPKPVPTDDGEPTDPPPEDDIITFNVKRSELPEVLRPYKDGDEIIKTAAHARTFANKAEEKLENFETLNAENKSLKEQMEALQEDIKKLKEKPLETPAQTQTVMDELDQSIEKLGMLDDGDYANIGLVKTVVKDISEQVKTVKGKLDKFDELEERIKKTETDVNSKFETIDKSNKETTEKEKRKALVKSLKKLQDDYPELKLSKPLIPDSVEDVAFDCVENDMFKYAKKVLGGLYNNYSPNMANVSAFINAYLKDEPAIKEYCEKNAITPESIGSSRDDIQKYAIISNIHERVNGKRIRPDGTVEEIKNMFTNDKVTYPDHVSAYKALKDESGIADKELKDMIIEAEKRGQKRMGDAMNRRASEPITLGGAGETSPEDIGQQLTESQAREFLKDPDIEFKMHTQALEGNREIFHKANKCLKRIMGDKYEPFEADPTWPPEIKMAK